MDASIALILFQDGCVTGAVYALLAVGLVLVFSVTRVIFIPQGEMVTYGALTIAGLQLNAFPVLIYLQIVLGLYVFAQESFSAYKLYRQRLSQRVRQHAQANDAQHQPRDVAKGAGTVLLSRSLALCFAQFVIYPLLLWASLVQISTQSSFAQMSLLVQTLLTLMLVAPLGPMLYKSVFEPLSDASILVLLIVSVALHLSLMGLGLWMFGAEGGRSKAILDLHLDWGSFTMSGQSLFVVLSSALIMIAFSLFFHYSMIAKALRATAINRLGASLMGINVKRAGQLSFLLAASLGAFSGILIGPITTIYYDSGFIIGLKGFVGAILGGLAGYPLAAAGALWVGLMESYISFWASAYKEVWVFSLIIPVLMWRSFKHPQLLEEDDSL
jgi:branched-chain amino acid transport system permease protein